ncbi:MAG: hypothetical protein HQL67_10290 [Magnetococcales bacterium]|nr:hypothetical protein [Magnetococcales bacterium]
MNTLIDIPIFEAGQHRDMNGLTLTLTEMTLKETASIYHADRHEAPLVIGHPQHNAPAWGWVAGLKVENGVLLAYVKQVDPAFRELVQAGRYKKISSSFYTPDSASNPVPGSYYLRHVGFLGAHPPAIKGLGDASFEEEESGIITFGHSTDPTWPARNDQPEHNNFSEITIQQEKKMDNEQEEPISTPESLLMQKQELDQREAELNRREEALHKQERESAQTRLTTFVDQLIDEGRILPRDRAGLLALMERLQASGVIEFSESGPDGEPVASEALNYFQDFVSRLPIQVDFSESLIESKQKANAVSYSPPKGYQVDPDGLATHNQIMAFAKEKNIDYHTAALSLGQ